MSVMLHWCNPRPLHLFRSPIDGSLIVCVGPGIIPTEKKHGKVCAVATEHCTNALLSMLKARSRLTAMDVESDAELAICGERFHSNEIPAEHCGEEHVNNGAEECQAFFSVDERIGMARKPCRRANEKKRFSATLSFVLVEQDLFLKLVDKQRSKI